MLVYEPSSVLSPDTLFSKSELCRIFNISKDTLRYYEKEQLIPPAIRNANQYCYYSADHVKALRMIITCKYLGFTLSHIRDLLSGSLCFAGYHDLLNSQLTHLTKELCSLEKKIDYLKGTLHLLPSNYTVLDHIRLEKNITFQITLENDLAASHLSHMSLPHIYSLKILRHIGLHHYKLEATGSPYIPYSTDLAPHHITLPFALCFTTRMVGENLHEKMTQIKNDYKSLYHFSPILYIVEFQNLNNSESTPLVLKIILPCTPIKERSIGS